jgi:hypothetical protein
MMAAREAVGQMAAVAAVAAEPVGVVAALAGPAKR